MRNLQPHAPFIGLAARSYMVNIAGSPWRQERVSHIEASPTWQQNASDVGTSVRTNKPGFHIVFQKWDGSCLEASQTNKFIAAWHHMTSSELTQVEPPSASSDVTLSNHHVMSSEGGGASCLTAVAIGGTQVLWDVPVSFSVWGSAPNWTEWMLEDKRFHIYYVRKTNQHIQFLFSDTKWFSLVVRVGRWMFKADLQTTSHTAALDQGTSSGTFSSWFQNQWEWEMSDVSQETPVHVPWRFTRFLTDHHRTSSHNWC